MRFGDGIDWDAEARRAAAATANDTDVVRASSLELVARLRGHGITGRLLDAGCNIARYYPPLKEAGFEYVGVDQSAEALRIAKERYPEAKFVHSFLWDMSFPEPFDVAISMAVLQHNKLIEKRRILQRIFGAVAKGGYFAMQESTVLDETPTQLRHDQWINLVQDHGFKFLSAWHPNPEYGVNDAYLFQRVWP